MGLGAHSKEIQPEKRGGVVKANLPQHGPSLVGSRHSLDVGDVDEDSMVPLSDWRGCWGCGVFV